MTPIQLLSKVIRDLLLSTTSAEPLERHHQSDWPPRDVIFAHSQFLANIYKYDRTPLSLLRSLQESSITIDILFMHVINSSCLLSLASFETDKCRLTELRWYARVSAALGIGHLALDQEKLGETLWRVEALTRDILSILICNVVASNAIITPKSQPYHHTRRHTHHHDQHHIIISAIFPFVLLIPRDLNSVHGIISGTKTSGVEGGRRN